MIVAWSCYLEISEKKDVSEVKSESENEGDLVSDTDYIVSSTGHANGAISGKFRLP
jgi:hypothetical protein